jgi:hypothetical protein
MNTVKLAHPVSFLLAALIGLTAGACKQGGGDLRIENVCQRHCDAMQKCNDIDMDDCMNTCVETANECDSESDVDMALDKLDQCEKDSSCSDLAGCGTEAWIECKL